MSLEDILKALDRNNKEGEELVKKELERIKKGMDKDEGTTPSGKLMARDKKRGIAVMTEGASSMSDARRTIAINNPKKNNSEHIFKPLGDN